MLPDRVSNTGPLTYESGALPIALRGPAPSSMVSMVDSHSGPRMLGIGEIIAGLVCQA